MLLDVAMKVFEDSIVAGGFIFLLYHVLHKQDLQLKDFGEQMRLSNETLAQISRTLTTFDSRLQKLEKDDENAS